MVKPRGLIILLAVLGLLGGVWACGRTGVEVFDEVANDGGGQDATLDSDSKAERISEAGDGQETLAAFDSSGDVVLVDAPVDSHLDVGVADVVLDAPSGHEAGDAGRTDVPSDSGGEVAVTDAASDSPPCPAADSGPEPPSCAPGGPGMTNCGPGGSGTESCCTSLEVCGGMYYRTYTNSGRGPTGEADMATVSAFRLDKYLVTVGRFRQFVAAWNGGYYPTEGSGKHAHLNGGHGLENSGDHGTYVGATLLLPLARYFDYPFYRSDDYGFRCARTL